MTKIVRVAGAALLLGLSVGCGPIIGQAMKATNGVKQFQVREGALKDFSVPRRVLVYAPFAKGEKGYYVCRGEDEANLAEGFQKEGVFQTAYFFERRPDRAQETLKSLRLKTPVELQKDLGLPFAPEAILSGTILEREDNVAPTAGVIQTLRLRLDLHSLEGRKSASVEITVKEMHQKTVELVCRELKRRLSS